MQISIALDWTPNTQHTGFYVAQARGLYRAAGLDVRLIAADQGSFAHTPARAVLDGQVTLAIAPAESVINARAQLQGPTPIAVATLAQTETSAVVTLAASGRERPRDLDGCLYASYGAPFECQIVAEMVRADGGRGEFTETHPPRLGVWRALQEGEADAAWLVLPWEGLEAELRGIVLNVFAPHESGVPYGYASLLLAHPRLLADEPEALRAFLQASAAGFRRAATSPDEAATLLREQADHPTLSDASFVQRSQRRIAPAYLTPDGRWGLMERARWQRFADWLQERRISAAVEVDRLFSNAYLA